MSDIVTKLRAEAAEAQAAAECWDEGSDSYLEHAVRAAELRALADLAEEGMGWRDAGWVLPASILDALARLDRPPNTNQPGA